MSKTVNNLKSMGTGYGAGVLAAVFDGVAAATGAGAFVWVPAAIGIFWVSDKYMSSYSWNEKPFGPTFYSFMAGLLCAACTVPEFDFSDEEKSTSLNPDSQGAYEQLIEVPKPLELPENITLSR